jgi:hypothetical protein
LTLNLTEQSTKLVLHTALHFLHVPDSGVGIRYTTRFGRIQFLKQLNNAVR